MRDGRTGGVTAIQRFGSGLNLHVHIHVLVLDGVFEGDDEPTLRLQDERPWNADEVARDPVWLTRSGRLVLQ